MSEPFSTQLLSLRNRAQLTNEELALAAGVPESLISGLQNNNRRVGEFQARKIGVALNLNGDALDQFIYEAINTCTEKVLNQAKEYPSQLLNHLALQLRHAGILPDTIQDMEFIGNSLTKDIRLTLASGRQATLKTALQYA